jgi:ATP-dependent protease ClpP protease subunit
MLKQVRSDLTFDKDSKVKTLRVALASGGGPVFTSLEIARLVRDASDKGLVVEIHAEMMCASGCTLVLASGTPNHRFISKWALFLVHPPQSDGGCVQHVDVPKTQEEKVTNVLFDLMRDAYVRFTNQSKDDVEKWLTCGNENVGNGQLAVTLHVADAVE